MEIEKRVGYYIHGRTGCTCCASDNFVRGMEKSLDQAVETVKWHRKNKTVASQYAPNGVYHVYMCEYEVLPDGRIIIGDRVSMDGHIDLSGDEANNFAGYGSRIQIDLKG